MIVCPRYRFVYLGPPKTASTSLHHWLSQAAFCATRWSPAGRTDQHDAQIPAEAGDFFTFASIRNPYARAVSLWRHSQSGGRRDGLPEMSFEESLETTTLMIWHAEKWCSPLLKHFMQIAEAKIRPPG